MHLRRAKIPYFIQAWYQVNEHHTAVFILGAFSLSLLLGVNWGLKSLFTPSPAEFPVPCHLNSLPMTGNNLASMSSQSNDVKVEKRQYDGAVQMSSIPIITQH